MSSGKRLSLILVGIWLALIFVTSCFVIPFEKFVSFIQGLSDSPVFKADFAQFWAAGWLIIVKGWHATEYAVLLLLGTLALKRVTPWSVRKCVGVAFLCAVLFAASDEWHQTFVPGRDGNVRDVLIDAGGATLSAVLLLLHSRKTMPHRA